MLKPIAKIALAIVLSFAITSCSAGTQTAQQLAARETESDANLWDAEDYKTIAAKSCIKYGDANKKALGDLYADWNQLFIEYTMVNLTSGALDDDPKWGPIAELVNKFKDNALNRSLGGSGVEVPTDLAVEVFNLCNEIGFDLNEQLALNFTLWATIH